MLRGFPLPQTRVSARLAGLFLAAGLTIPAGTPPARAETPAEAITVARDFFLIADYPDALEKITSVLEVGPLTPAEHVAAWELEARCRVALGNRLEGIDSFCSALQLVPSWRPDLTGFTDAEREAFGKAMDLCGPLRIPAPHEVEPAPDPAVISPPAETGEEGAKRWAAALGNDRPWYRNPWVLGGMGGAIVGVAFLTLGGGHSAPVTPLPGFPPPPE